MDVEHLPQTNFLAHTPPTEAIHAAEVVNIRRHLIDTTTTTATTTNTITTTTAGHHHHHGIRDFTRCIFVGYQGLCFISIMYDEDETVFKKVGLRPILPVSSSSIIMMMPSSSTLLPVRDNYYYDPPSSSSDNNNKKKKKGTPTTTTTNGSSSSSSKAFDFMLFAASTLLADVQDLEAAAILAESKLGRGSRIDVWADDQFWAARITRMNEKGFFFRYCCKYGNEGGFVKREHFQVKWRFPVETPRQMVFAEALKKITTTDPVV